MSKNTKNKRSRSRKSVNKGSRSQQSPRAGRSKPALVFAKQNYLLMILGIVLVVFGYTIMRMENEVDGFISLYVAPLIILGGYLEIIYAILWRPRRAESDASAPDLQS